MSQQIADEIYSLIVEDKEFKPGDQLPNENDLSERLGVSRATLREAIRILTVQGILEVYRGKGTFIAQDLKAYEDFELGNNEIIRARLRDLYEARLLFEPEITALACHRATDEELSNIIQMGRRVEQAIVSGQDRTEYDQSFHRAIVAASHNDFMLRLMPIINRAVAESILLNKDNGALAEDTIRDHAMVMDFLQRRDPDGAKHAMSLHIRHGLNNLKLKDPVY